jgi:ribonuclease D
VADLLKLLLKIRAREIDVAAACWPAATIWNCWPPACARVCRSGRLALWRVWQGCAGSGGGKLAFAVVKGRLKMTHVDECMTPDAPMRPPPPMSA